MNAMRISKSRAFTLVEIMVVVVVISILASMIIVGYSSVQKDTRDSARSSKSTVIAEALERYYNKNNEYPSVASLAGQSIATIKTKLSIKDDDVLVFPKGAAGTSAIVSSSPSTTRLAYTGATIDSSANTQCQTDVNGYCDSYLLQYVEESGGATIALNSRQGPDVAATTQAPQVIAYSDDFTGTGVLGNVKTGTPTIAWQFFNSTSGNWSRNSSGYASSTIAASSKPIAAADVGMADVAISEGTQSTGAAIYFRVVDSNNWLRARVDETESQQSSTSTWYSGTINYQVRNEPTWYSTSGPAGNTPSEAISLCQSWAAQNQANGNYTAWSGCNTGNQQTSTSYTYTYNYSLILDKSAGGSVTQLASKSLGSSLPAYIKVIANGSSIQTSYGSTSSATSAGSTVTDSTNQSATKHGVGYAASSYGSPTGIKSITITNAP